MITGYEESIVYNNVDWKSLGDNKWVTINDYKSWPASNDDALYLVGLEGTL